MFIVVATLLVFIATLVFILNWQKHSYWKSRGVLTPSYFPIIGHFHKLFSRCRWEGIDEIYKKYKFNGYWGMYEGYTPMVYISDPALLREIMVKNADHFIDRRPLKRYGGDEIFNEMLIKIRGEEWKSLRSIMSPTFTSGKIKAMFHLIAAKSDELVSQCNQKMNKSSYVEMVSILEYYAMDVIATCAFGIDAHCLQKKEASQFVKSASYLSTFNLEKLVKFVVLRFFPKLSRVLRLQFGGESLKFFVDTAKETVALRKKSGVKRGDFLDLMLEALEESNKENYSKYPMTMNTVIAESVLFLISGFHTTSGTLSFMTYLLAKNPDTQKRLREELKKLVDADGELTYENIMEAQYLDACLSETLRLYCPAHFLERCCTKSYNLPDTDLEIPENMIVGIPVWSVHRDSEYWEDPLTFIPDRFLPENKRNIRPYTYLPFGLGPRNCIGIRFAQLEAKLAIAKLCLTFHMELRPGFNDITLEKTFGGIKPNKDGVQLVLKNSAPLS